MSSSKEFKLESLRAMDAKGMALVVFLLAFIPTSFVLSQTTGWWRIVDGVLALVLVAAIAVVGLKHRFGSLANANENYRLRNRIGFQNVWMLNEDGALQKRVERRDHQNAERNTCELVVYEKLGGSGPEFWVARRDAGASIAVPLNFRLRAVEQQGGVDVPPFLRITCGGGTYRSEMTLGVETFLRVLNETRGQDFDDAFRILLRGIEETTARAKDADATLEEVRGELAGIKVGVAATIAALRRDRRKLSALFLDAYLALIEHEAFVQNTSRLRHSREGGELQALMSRRITELHDRTAAEFVGGQQELVGYRNEDLAA